MEKAISGGKNVIQTHVLAEKKAADEERQKFDFSGYVPG